MARTTSPKRRTSSIAWLKAGDARLVIKHHQARDRQILQALDALVSAPRPAAQRRTLAA
jgi:hypothetical protein